SIEHAVGAGTQGAERYGKQRDRDLSQGWTPGNWCHPSYTRARTWVPVQPDFVNGLVPERVGRRAGSAPCGWAYEPSVAVAEAAFARSAAQTRSGVAGISWRRTPAAWWMALVTAGATAMIGVSPRPLAPYGPHGNSSSTRMERISGVSSVVGMM